MPSGALEGEDQRIFEEHLRRGCTACEAELRSLGEVTASLGSAVQAEPPAGLRSRLLAKVRSAPRVPGALFEQGGLLISRSAEVAWQTMAPGIEFKPLHIDQARKYNTCLVRMDAGAHYPSHRHREIEELFMLSGELHVEGLVMHAGDYCRRRFRHHTRRDLYRFGRIVPADGLTTERSSRVSPLPSTAKSLLAIRHAATAVP
jgi:hypothetical protein